MWKDVQSYSTAYFHSGPGGTEDPALLGMDRGRGFYGQCSRAETNTITRPSTGGRPEGTGQAARASWTRHRLRWVAEEANNGVNLTQDYKDCTASFWKAAKDLAWPTAAASSGDEAGISLHPNSSKAMATGNCPSASLRVYDPKKGLLQASSKRPDISGCCGQRVSGQGLSPAALPDLQKSPGVAGASSSDTIRPLDALRASATQL